MNKNTLIFVLVLLAIVGVYLAYRLFKYHNSPEGERHARMRMQGAFVPLSKEELEQDQARAAGRHE
ncbi:hypothetical protein [Undibacterium sp.]|uniref:hypothetical protein n=1 Tax=Undibacterium sp. TaxID=1914977 RepID=UPI0025DD3F4F|nr:hypothetical protein [Undibacterium sp.]MCX7217879.1 hypothetical protein [Burkholderiales bacterium]